MFQIKRLSCEGLENGCVTDEKNPAFSFSLDSDKTGVSLASADLVIGDTHVDAINQIAVPYQGKALKPFTTYKAELHATASNGEEARKTIVFETGRMDTPWTAQWISDASYRFTEKKVSPIPMQFRKVFSLQKPVKEARIYATAMGIYELDLNGKKVGNRYFAPGFTSYKTNLQYQTYDVTNELQQENQIDVTVAGGWAVGSFVFTRVNRVAADRQALLLELRILYQDGSTDIIGTDSSWLVTENGKFRMADLYDGETFDATISDSEIKWNQASVEQLRIKPNLYAEKGAPVVAHEERKPVSSHKSGETWIYDFGQNLAGVVRLKVKAAKGQVIKVKHAEVLNPDGSLNVTFLRTAKATATYVCTEGEQTYSPRLTYMGFRYVSVEGIDPEHLSISAVALYSDLRGIGSFTCSNPMLNQLQSNITWGAKSNLVDIPTDCPQRDERMGWTGDIAVFGPTACFNFDMGRFLDKWLRDVRAEQTRGGGIPNTVPVNGYGFPATMPEMAIDWWGDACVLVPWAIYQANGDSSVLEENYAMMKKYVKACKFWANLLSVGKRRYLWHTPATLHFGDWVAPDVPLMSQWQKRSKWTATASLFNTSSTLAKIADILGKKEDSVYYTKLAEKVADAYEALLTDGNGKLKEEFQTAYVLPLHFKMFREDTHEKAAENLVKLVEKADYCIGTGFPGTPYILFALADSGHADTAYKMLLNTKCPSWLYEVKMGATTIWERWDGLDESGNCPIGNDGTDIMISYNHYASGAVGDFLYQKVAGLVPLKPAYRSFKVEPLLGGDLTQAEAAVESPYGTVKSSWQIHDQMFTLSVHVPVGCTCEVCLPNGEQHSLLSGTHQFSSILR